MTTLTKKVETTKADAIAEIKASWPFIDACAVYYGDRFEGCLKQVKPAYQNLDLSKVTMDDPLSTTPADGNIVNEETNETLSMRH